MIDILGTAEGSKTLVIEASLVGPITLIIDLSREPGVEQIESLTAEQIPTSSQHIFFISRPSVESMKMIAHQIRMNTREGRRKNYSLYFVPRSTVLAEKALEEEGVFADLTIGHYNLDLLPIEDDVLSLELNNAFRECFLDGDKTCLFDIANALMKLQVLFGTIPIVQGIGHAALAVKDIMLRLSN